ncbi:hypothetical protein OQA88_119 [Cercophora sp. LCS_1]
MAQPKAEASINQSSPHSSGGADSFKQEGGTPDTKLTVFSPDEQPTAHPVKPETTSAQFPGLPKAEGLSATPNGIEKDPFVSAAIPKVEQKLSPTALAFRPLTHGRVVSGSALPAAVPQTFVAASGNGYNGRGLDMFTWEMNLSRYLCVSSATTAVTLDNVNSYLAQLQAFGAPAQGRRTVIPGFGRVYIQVSNIYDSIAIYNYALACGFDWNIAYISAGEFYRATIPEVKAAPVENASDGLIEVNVTVTSVGSPQAPPPVDVFLVNLLGKEGQLFAYRRMGDFNVTTYRAVAEFADVDVALVAAARLNSHAEQGYHLSAVALGAGSMTPGHNAFNAMPVYGPSPTRRYMGDMTNMFQTMGVKTPQTVQNNMSPNGLPGGFGALTPAAPHFMQQQYPVFPVAYPSMTSPVHFVNQTPTRRPGMVPGTPMTPMSVPVPAMVSPVFTPPTTPMNYAGDWSTPRSVVRYSSAPNMRRQSSMAVTRASPYQATPNSNHHNQVDVARIREGIDVRTTIMLRNIPNKVDQAMLKTIIDESSWGKYDFMYLRIDFANDCNVGYAFINFVDPLDIIDFVDARANQRWNCFKSDKVAEVSYATIQGKDCLVQKFRNSSVMLEAPHYRPKLYYTCNGPKPDKAGEEEPFPKPDNQSKMKRSCENAEHVGLFTPSSGQQLRDDQRRRRSQFDRGTRLAALEEYEYSPSAEQPGFVAPGQH